jgi:NAD(P)-dependent dehydrogenase (short-subunit alcohol dehydrogenase family)
MSTPQTVLVIGGTSGMGRATAQLLAARGEDKASAFEQRARSLLVGRVGRPEDVASTVVHLIDNGFTTGAIHHVDGGAPHKSP